MLALRAGVHDWRGDIIFLNGPIRKHPSHHRRSSLGFLDIGTRAICDYSWIACKVLVSAGTRGQVPCPADGGTNHRTSFKNFPTIALN